CYHLCSSHFVPRFSDPLHLPSFPTRRSSDLMDMFQHALDRVDIQNHSWGNAFPTLSRPSAMEAVAISNAIENGRGGRGVLIVRSDRKSTRLNSSHVKISYAVFCLKKKKQQKN